MLYNELPLPFPWYDKVAKQDRYRENVAPLLWYKLISPKNALLPFQFYHSTPVSYTITAWQVFDAESLTVIANITAQSGAVKKKFIAGLQRQYFYYNGQDLGLSMEPGKFYFSSIILNDGSQYFSEMFYCADFSNTDTEIPFIKFEYWNESDINPILYNDFTGNVPYYRNRVYLNTFITQSEPQIEVEGKQDGNGEIIPTFTKYKIPHIIHELVPDYLKKALVAMQMHDHVILTTANGVRSGELDQLETVTNSQVNGGYAEITITFEETLIVKRGCGKNME